MESTADLPVGLLRYGQKPLRLLQWGVPMGPLRLLRTRGRQTGQAHVVPVAVLRHRGREWLVSPFGETRWVRDVRASGTAELGRGRDYRAVDLTEIDDRTKIGVLRAYRRRFRLVPFVREAFTAGPADPPEIYLAERDRHPVFLIHG
jgi:deazaflavin-dependent oxidoreductase (nitroreductase family)